MINQVGPTWDHMGYAILKIVCGDEGYATKMTVQAPGLLRTFSTSLQPLS